MRSSMRGFTLTELMVATALTGIVMMAMGGFYVTSVKNQKKSIRAALLGNQVTLIRRSLERALVDASFIETPSVGGKSASASVLVAWKNVDGDNSGEAIVAGQPRRFTYLCIDKNKRNIYLYEGAKYPKPNFKCGGNVSSGVASVHVAGGKNMTLSLRFSRLAAEPNVLLVEYSVAIVGEPQGARVHATQYVLQRAK